MISVDKSLVEQYLGSRIVIIGSPGAGKTTLAIQLGKILEIPVFHLDRFFWQPCWIGEPGDVRKEKLEKLIQQEQWIIEGTYLRSSEPRLRAADTIIFLDMSTWLCLRRVIYRHFKDIIYHKFKDKKRSRPDLPDGCSSNQHLRRMLLKVLFFRIRHHEELSQTLHNYESSKRVFCLHSPEEVESFLIEIQKQQIAKDSYNDARDYSAQSLTIEVDVSHSGTIDCATTAPDMVVGAAS